MELQQAYHELQFENAFLKSKGDAFQTFFENLMTRAYKADFMACRPWGKEGDKKNDGFLKSEKRLFQVYAPNEMEASKAIAKIKEDFEGAKKYWKSYFDKWTFVHNAYDGLPPHVQQLILELEKNNQGLIIETWSLEELRVIFRKLSIDDKQSWFGLAPTNETKSNLGFNDIKVILENLSSTNVPPPAEIKTVPAGKIKANALSEAVVDLLHQGITKSYVVQNFLDQWYDSSLGERLSLSFNNKYKELKAQYTPNQIFYELQKWVGGGQRGTPEHEFAVITVLAYFFERCDIFEEPKGEIK
jgi:hypothetical protein